MTREFVILIIKLVRKEIRWNAAVQSSERVPGKARSQPAGNGKTCRYPRQTISQIERGDYSPSVTLALKIAKACGATVEDIFEYAEEKNASITFPMGFGVPDHLSPA